MRPSVQHENRALCWNLLLLTWGGAALAAALGLPAPQSLTVVDTLDDVVGEASPVTATTGGWRESRNVTPTMDVQGQPDVTELRYPAGFWRGMQAWVSRRYPARPSEWNGRGLAAHRAPQHVRGETEHPVADSTDALPEAQRTICCCQQEDPGVIGWFKAHQNPDGYLCPAMFPSDSSRSAATKFGNLALAGTRAPDTGLAEARLEATALALLVMAGTGYDHKEGEYKNLCRQMLLWLKSQQQEDGCFGKSGGPGIRAHALATMAFAETYGLSGDATLKPLVEKALTYLVEARSARGGWAEDHRGYAPDCVSTTLSVVAFKYALMANVEIDSAAAQADAAQFMDRLVAGSPGARYVRYSETQVRACGPSGVLLPHALPICEAAFIVTMLFTRKHDLRSETIKDCVVLLSRPESAPVWEAGRIDTLYWWLGAMAAYAAGGKTWKKVWEPAMAKELLGNQRGFSAAEKEAGATSRNTDEFGSWDVHDAWGARVGRVGSTAMTALALQYYYRFERSIERDPPDIGE